MYQKISPKTEQPDMILYTDIVYSNQFNGFLQENIPLKMHIIRPFYEKKKWEKLPLLIWLSGGAFRSCSPARNIPYLVEFAKKGYVVASVGYRVSSNSCFPTQVQDVKAAVRFLKHYHEKYGINPEQVVIAGHSAGAYLAGMTAVTEGVELFETDEWNDVSSSVKGAICVSGGDHFIEDRFIKNPQRAFSPIELLMGFKLEENPPKMKQASMAEYINKKTPPFLLIQGEMDEMVPIEINKLFYQKMTELGKEIDFYEIEGAGHGTIELWQPEIQQIILDFLKYVVSK